MSAQKYLLGKMQVNHLNVEKLVKKADDDEDSEPVIIVEKDAKLEHALTQITVNNDCTRMVSADTAGRLKLWDISKVDWIEDGKDGNSMSTKMREIWLI